MRSARGTVTYRLKRGRQARRGADHADFGGHAHFAKKIVLHALHVEVDAAGWLGDEFDGAEFESFQRAGCAFAGFRADDDDGARVGGHDLRGGLQTIDVGHVDVHGDDIRLQGFGQRDGFAPVFGVADDL